MRYLFSLAVLLACAAFANAASGKVRGTVRDTDGKPIEKVTITIESTGEVRQKYTAHTNAKGEYIHIGIYPGNYRITPSREGYQPVEYSYIETRVTLDEKGFVADFKMQRVTVQQGAAKSEAAESEQLKQAKLGKSLLDEGKADEAIAAFNKALEADPNLAAAHYYIAVAYEKKDQNEEAQKHLEEAIRLKPDLGQGYLMLGDLHMAARKFDLAAEALMKASELMPEEYAAFYNLGVAYSNSGKYVEAEAAYRKAALIKPDEPIAHYQLGMSLLGQSKNAEAKAEFQKYLELNPNAADKQEVLDLIQTLQ
jgi:tetratricopeptide (TPR) repeat protein